MMKETIQPAIGTIKNKSKADTLQKVARQFLVAMLKNLKRGRIHLLDGGNVSLKTSTASGPWAFPKTSFECGTTTFTTAKQGSKSVISAILFYLIFIAGMLVFVIEPASAAQSAMRALWLGMFYGLVTYATFDLTSLALFKGWPPGIVVADIIWGIVLSGMVSSAGYRIAGKLGMFQQSRLLRIEHRCRRIVTL